jgi:hypothetical protein
VLGGPPCWAVHRAGRSTVLGGPPCWAVHRAGRSTVLGGPPWCAARGVKSWCSRSKNIFSQLRRDGRLDTHFHGGGHHAARPGGCTRSTVRRGSPCDAVRGLHAVHSATQPGVGHSDDRCTLLVTAPQRGRVGSPPHTHAPTCHLPNRIDGDMHTHTGTRWIRPQLRILTLFC